MPKWMKPFDKMPDVRIGDRVCIIVLERANAASAITPRLVILIATETGWDAVDEAYSGYSIYDGVLWCTEQDICEIAREIA